MRECSGAGCSKRHIRSLTSLTCALLLVAAAASGYWLANRPTPIRTIRLTFADLRKINTDGSASFSSGPDGILQVSVPTGHLQWYGLYYPARNSCNYTLRLEAKHHSQKNPKDGAGWGYGISIRSTWNPSNSTANGWTVQDEFLYTAKRLQSDVRITNLSNVNSDPYFPFGMFPIYTWVHWAIAVHGATVQIKRNNVLIGSFPISGSCGGVFLRVWAETVQFRNITLTTS